MSADLMGELDDETREVLATEMSPASRSSIVEAVVDGSADAWLLSVSKYVVLVLNDRSAAGRLRDSWFTSLTHAGVVGTVKSVLNQAITSGITESTIVDAVRRAVQVILLELQDVVPACKATGVPVELYEEVVLVVGHALMSDIIETTLAEV